MKKSVNTLRFDSLEKVLEPGKYYNQFEVKLNATILFRCPVTGNAFAQLAVCSYAKNPDMMECIRMTIEKFFNGDISIDIMDVNPSKRDCVMDRNGLHHVDYNCFRGSIYHEIFETLLSKDFTLPKLIA